MNSAAFSPDGSRIVTASGDKTARIWDAASGKEIAVLRGHEDHVLSAAFSPDGSRIVTASLDNTARIWDAASAKEIAVLRGHEGQVYSAAFSPDGSRIVTASVDQTARIWDAATAKEIAVLRGHEAPVRPPPSAPTDRGSSLRRWTDRPDLERRDRQGDRGLARPRAGNRYAAFSPDGLRIVTASCDKTARIWDVRVPMMPVCNLLAEICTRRLGQLTKLTRNEMRLAGYPDNTPEIDVCPGRE